MQHNPTQAGINEQFQAVAALGIDDAKARLKEKAGKVKAVMAAYKENGSSFDGLAELDGSNVGDKRTAFRKMQEEALGLKMRIDEVDSVANAATPFDTESRENDSHVNAINNRSSNNNGNATNRRNVMNAREAYELNERNMFERVLNSGGFTGDRASFYQSVARNGLVLSAQGPEARMFYDIQNVISSGASTGFEIFTPLSDTFIRGIRPTVHALDFVRRVTTRTDSWKYRAQTQTEQLNNRGADTAARTARGWKAENALSTAEAIYKSAIRTATVHNIFGFSQPTMQQLADYDGGEAFINEELRLDVRRNMELALLWGAGSDEEPMGLFHGITALDFDAPAAGETEYGLDYIAQAMFDKVFTDTQQMPTNVMMDARDWRKLITTRDANGNLQFLDPADVTNQVVLGMPVSLSSYTSLAGTAGTVLVGDFLRGGAMVDRQDVTIEKSDSHGTTFLQGTYTIRVSARMGVARFHDGSFVPITNFEGKKSTSN